MQQRNKSEKIGWNKSESWKQVMKPIVLPFKYRWISYSDSEGFVHNHLSIVLCLLLALSRSHTDPLLQRDQTFLR